MTNTAKTPHPATAGHSERNISFDLIRILAIFLVMYNHRETYIFYHHVPRMGLRYILSMCGAAFCKCGPPLFFMVSGALILHKKESFRRIFRHRILRIPSYFQFTIRKQLLEPGISGTCLLSGQFFQTRRKPGPKKADSSDTSDRYHRQPGHRHASDEL